MPQAVVGSADAFLDELEKDAGDVERGIVRISYRIRQDPATGMNAVSVCASAVIGANVLLFEQYVGQTLGVESEHDAGVMNSADTLKAKLTEGVEAIGGLEVREGAYLP